MGSRGRRRGRTGPGIGPGRRVRLLLALWVVSSAAPAVAAPDCEPLAHAAFAAAASAGEPPAAADPEARPDERSAALLVLPKDAGGAIPTDFELAPGAELVESRFSALLCSTVVRVAGPPGRSPDALLARVPDTAFVVPDSVYRTADAELRPVAPGASGPPGTDPYRDLQYGLAWTGADQARALTRGRGARVAILDSAPDASHPELAGLALHRVTAEASTPATHGTLVAGVIGATEGNGLGIAGVAPEAELLAFPVCTPTADPGGDLCRLYTVLGGLDASWEARAQVLNLSLAGPANRALELAVRRLEQLRVLVVAAAGNDASEDPRFPAAYPSVIGVGAADRSGGLAALSNRGASAEILAPGAEILSTVPGGGFAFGDGTSLATAHVSGVLALLVALGSEPEDARGALFQAGFAAPAARPERAVLPRLCEALERLGTPCPTS